MLIFDEKVQAIILDSIFTPTITSHFWVLDLDIMDFTIAPITVFEEVTCPSLEIQIFDYKFILPCAWNILIVSEDTSQLDIVELSKSLGRNLNAFVYGNNQKQFEIMPIIATNYFPLQTNVTPLLNKNQLLCHPIAPDKWICISPFDVYNKYLKDASVCDIV